MDETGRDPLDLVKARIKEMEESGEAQKLLEEYGMGDLLKKKDPWVMRVQPDPDECRHTSCLPEFDEEAAKGLDEYEVRKRWPRFWGICPDCGQRLIAYASAMHYIMGDW